MKGIGSRIACNGEESTIAPHALDHVPIDPFQSLEFTADPRQQKSLACTAAQKTPRDIAGELMTLQKLFVDAHEREVRELQKLLTSNAVYMSIAERIEDEAAHDPCDKQQRRTVAGSPRLTDEKHAEVQPALPLILGQDADADERTDTNSSRPRSESPSAAGADGRAEVVRSSANSRNSGGLRKWLSDSLAQLRPKTNAFTARVSNGEATSKSDWAKSSMANGKARQSQADRSLNEIISTIDPGHGRKLSMSPSPFKAGGMAFTDYMNGLCENVYFDLVCGFVIVSNAMFMAYEAEHALTEPVGTPYSQPAIILGKTFTLFFVLELVLRMCGGLHKFFCTCNAWNYFDFFIVTLSVADEFILATASLSNARMVRLLRLTRTLKILRMIRIVRIVNALRTLVNSLMGTIRQVFWAFVLIACPIFVFSVNFGELVGQARDAGTEFSHPELLRTYWGSVPLCMYTLFMSVTGGISWWEAALPLGDLGWAVVLAFLFYVASIQWVVLNVITGCFCESAAEAARKDVSLAVQAFRSDRDRFLHQCKAIFRCIDLDSNGLVQPEEMRQYLDSEPARALFSAMEIDIEDAYGIFELLDEDGSDSIDLEEFMWGCMQLRGGAKALAIAKLQCQTTQIFQTLLTIEEALMRNQRKAATH
eukprot:TRINITY_DN11978_c0_g4_i1.p1 TRINITY_DN11978_c0_g4~~TRINITY_DN11978_c0_g4_i1.p1  ORF type:complete len:650 (+),score=87.48 TRINITY_DN11978_c0_g4_i1:62-2011(+)